MSEEPLHYSGTFLARFFAFVGGDILEDSVVPPGSGRENLRKVDGEMLW